MPSTKTRPQTPKAGVQVATAIEPSTKLQHSGSNLETQEQAHPVNQRQNQQHRQYKSVATFRDIAHNDLIHSKRPKLLHTKLEPSRVADLLDTPFIGTAFPLEEKKSPRSESAQRLKDAVELRDILRALNPPHIPGLSYSHETVLSVLDQAIEAFRVFVDSTKSPAHAITPPPSLWDRRRLSFEAFTLSNDIQFAEDSIYKSDIKALISSVLRRFHRFLKSDELGQHIKLSLGTTRNKHSRIQSAPAGTNQETAPQADLFETFTQITEPSGQSRSTSVVESSALPTSISVKPAHSSVISQTSEVKAHFHIGKNIAADGPVTPAKSTPARPSPRAGTRSASYTLAPSPVVNLPSKKQFQFPAIDSEADVHGDWSSETDFDTFKDNEAFHAAVNLRAAEFDIERSTMDKDFGQAGSTRPDSMAVSQINAMHSDRNPIIEAKNAISRNGFAYELGIDEDAARSEQSAYEASALHQRDVELHTLQKKTAILKDQNEDLLQKVLESEEHYAELEADLAEARHASDEANRNLHQARQDALQREEMLESQMTELQKAELALASSQSKITTKLSELEDQKQFAENSLAQKSEELTRMKMQKDALQKSLEQRRIEIGLARQQHKDLITAKMQLDQSEREKQDLKIELEKLREQLEHKERTISGFNENSEVPHHLGVSLADELGEYMEDQYSGSDPDEHSDLESGSEFETDTADASEQDLSNADAFADGFPAVKDLKAPTERFILSSSTLANEARSEILQEAGTPDSLTDLNHQPHESGESLSTVPDPVQTTKPAAKHDSISSSSSSDLQRSDPTSAQSPSTFVTAHSSVSGVEHRSRNNILDHSSGESGPQANSPPTDSVSGNRRQSTQGHPSAISSIGTSICSISGADHVPFTALSPTTAEQAMSHIDKCPSRTPHIETDSSDRRDHDAESASPYCDGFKEKASAHKTASQSLSSKDNERPTKSMVQKSRTKHRRTATTIPSSMNSSIPEFASALPVNKAYKRRSTGSVASIVGNDSSTYVSRRPADQSSSSRSKYMLLKRRSAESSSIFGDDLSSVVDSGESLFAPRSAPMRFESALGVEREQKQRLVGAMLDEVISLPNSRPHKSSGNYPAKEQISQRQQLHERSTDSHIQSDSRSGREEDEVIDKTNGRTVHIQEVPSRKAKMLHQTETDLLVEHPLFSILAQSLPVRTIRVQLRNASGPTLVSLLPWILFLIFLIWPLNGSSDGAFGTGGFRDDNWLTRVAQGLRDNIREGLHVRPDIAT